MNRQILLNYISMADGLIKELHNLLCMDSIGICKPEQVEESETLQKTAAQDLTSYSVYGLQGLFEEQLIYLATSTNRVLETWPVDQRKIEILEFKTSILCRLNTEKIFTPVKWDKFFKKNLSRIKVPRTFPLTEYCNFINTLTEDVVC